MQNRQCAVTGAGGFVGSHLVEALLAAGARVRALVHYNALGRRGHLDAIRNEDGGRMAAWIAEGKLEIVTGDVQDPRCLRNLVRECDCVFHLAALIGIPYSYVAPQAYVNVNVIGTLNILEACRDEKVGRLLHTSTSEAYGTARSTPIDERHPLQAQSPYSATKIAADKLAESYALSFGLPLATVRPFNVFGPRQSARALIPTILTQALSPRCEAVALGALDPIRDWTYVEDTVRAFVEIASAPIETVGGRLYNVGVGKGISIRDAAEAALKVVEVNKTIQSNAERTRPDASEVMELICDNRRIRDEVGWQPRVDFKEGLARTAEWIGKHLDDYHTGEYTI